MWLKMNKKTFEGMLKSSDISKTQKAEFLKHYNTFQGLSEANRKKMLDIAETGMDKFLQERHEIEKKIKEASDLRKTSEEKANEAKRQKKELTDAVEGVPNKPAKYHEISRPSVAGTKSEHVATTRPTTGSQTVSIDDDQLKELSEMVEIGTKQVDLLGSIDKKISNNKYKRNDPPYDEVTSTIWGN